MKCTVLDLVFLCRLCIVASLLASTTALPATAVLPEPKLLDPEQAFRIATRVLDGRSVEVRFAIADGYYMYRDKFRFETGAGAPLPGAEIPRGKVKDDPFFGRTEIHRGEVRIRVPVPPDDVVRGRVELKVTSQGCADVGVCYVPLVQKVQVRLPAGQSSAPGSVIPAAPPGNSTSVPRGGSR